MLLLALSLGCPNKDLEPEDTGVPCVPSDWYADADGDGFGSGEPLSACEAPSGRVEDATDCDDTTDAVYPGAPEDDCTDPVDYNCDGSVGFADEDSDGFAACEDCDDADADVNVQTVWYADHDADGHGGDETLEACTQPDGYLEAATDCDDDDASTHPGADETCDGQDDDCDGDVDESPVDPGTWYTDSDTDGYGDAGAPQQGCDQPSGTVEDASDCDDTDATEHPGADEVCDGDDDDCDGEVDEDSAIDASTWYADTDTDGYGDASSTTQACDQPSAHVADATDCDDTDGDTHPGADEWCDGHDDDCDGDVDEAGAVDAGTWYADTDSDGYGDASSTTVACDAPTGHVADASDCDDTDGTIHPAGTESCNATDDDCDSDVDEGVLGTGASCPAESCAEILADGTTTDGDYTLADAAGTTTFDTYCDLTTDSGGWTLAGSVVNEASVTGSHDRNWDSYAAWTDTTTFGALSTNETADFKSMAFSETPGDDLLIVTDEYSFAFYNVVGSVDFADFMAAEYDSTACSENFLASGADWADGLSTAQESVLSLVVRPQDTNASCFPNGNETVILGFQLSSCCWAGGLGNTPSGYPTWEIYDNSLVQLSSLSPSTCTAGTYPCNDAGYYNGAAGYAYTNKVTYAQIYVR